VRLFRLGASEGARLTSLERSAGAPPWVSEVEDFILLGGAASHLLDPTSTVLIAHDDAGFVGAAIHYPYPGRPGAQYICAVAITAHRQGARLGRTFVDLVVADARRSGRPYVAWVVHPENTVMMRLSSSIVASGAAVGIDASTGYVLFVDP
jgi:ribosomal protein S18 acetylase RimI-like enzyme